MTLREIIRGKKKEKSEQGSLEGAVESGIKKSKGISPIDALFSTGEYAKTGEEKTEKIEAASLKIRLSDLGIKRYKKEMKPVYDDNNNRLKIGKDYDLKNLPELIYKIAGKSGDFRSAIGGAFGRKERDSLKDIIRRERYKFNEMEGDLDNRNENKQKTSLGKLF